MSANYTIGLDYGTNSVRAVIVDVKHGREIATAVWNYAHGTRGVILSRDPNLARQHPADYVKGAETTTPPARLTAIVSAVPEGGETIANQITIIPGCQLTPAEVERIEVSGVQSVAFLD